MTEPFVGEIQLFGFNFNPRNWAFCNGALLPISQNTTLFSLLGTTYGGDGRSTFQLPNFNGRVGCGVGNGPGLTPRHMGETFGDNSVTLLESEMPAHTHGLNAYNQSDATHRVSAPVAGGGLSLLSSTSAKSYLGQQAPNTAFAPNMIGPAPGGGLPHENRQPYLGLNFCIALQGVYPSFP